MLFRSVLEAQLKALKRDEAELLNQYLEGDKDIQDIAEDKGISYDAAKQKLSRVRKRLKSNVTPFMRESL